MMLRTIIVLLLFAFCNDNLLAQDNEIIEGVKLDVETGVDPNVVGLYIGPDFPDNVFSKINRQFESKYYSFNHRIIISSAEIYKYLFIDLLATWDENDRVLISSYTIPKLSGFIIIDFIKWNSWDSFKLLLSSLNADYEANVTILPNGKFTISKKLIKKNKID